MDQKLSKEYIEGIYTSFLENNPTLRVSKEYFFKFYRLMNLKRKENRTYQEKDNSWKLLSGMNWEKFFKALQEISTLEALN